MSRHEEASSQRQIIRWWSSCWKLLGAPNESVLFHCPNGGRRSPQEGKWLKLEGVRAGVSDLILLLPRSGYHALVLELKTDEGRLSQAQKDFLETAASNGYKACVCFSTETAIQAITNYMRGQ
jgi:hypothetical protein